MRSIKRSCQVTTDPQTLFKALITPSSIKQWWKAQIAIVIPNNNGIYNIQWGDNLDDPDYITAARIKNINAPNNLLLNEFRYHAKTGDLGFEADFEVIFDIQDFAKESCLLTVKQSGFPIDKSADEYYKSCDQGWKDTLDNIKQFCEEKS